ncbi:MAG: hypothetical protein R2788_04530 [Saprospiraceae bacterium]
MLAVKNIAGLCLLKRTDLPLSTPCGNVPVVLDLMIHDIDIVLSLVKSPIKSISASGVPVVAHRT